MNNKGFAITSIIYGLMILFVMVVSSFLSILVGRMNRMDELLEGVYDSVKINDIVVTTNDFDEETKVYVTETKGLYNIEDKCLVYLPENVVIIKSEYINSNIEDQTNYFYSYGGSEDVTNFSELKCLD